MSSSSHASSYKVSGESLFTIDALRSLGEACTDTELACRAMARFGLSAGAKFCAKQGIALEDCLAALQVFDIWQGAKLWVAAK